MSNNQWWELLDTGSNCYYYHNPHTSETVWERPESDEADIISLTKLQSTPEVDEKESGVEEADANAPDTAVHSEDSQTSVPPEEVLVGAYIFMCI